MDKLYDKYYNKVKHEAVKLKREAKRMAELETPLEKNIREATANTNWGCANSVLYELAEACKSYSERQKIMEKIWEKLQGDEDKWRRLLKTLTLLEFLMKNGPEQILGELQSEQLSVRRLTSVKCMDEGQDRGAAVRDKAKLILDLMGDREALKAARDKAKEHRNKVQSSTLSSDGNSGRGGGGGAGGGGGGSGSGLGSSLASAAGFTAQAAGFTDTSLSRASFEEKFNELKRKQEGERKPPAAVKEDSGPPKRRDSPDRDRDRSNSPPRRGDRRRDDSREQDERGSGRGGDRRRPASGERGSRRGGRTADSDDDAPSKQGYGAFEPSGGPAKSDSDDDMERPPGAVDLLDFGADPAPASGGGGGDFTDFGSFEASPVPLASAFPSVPAPSAAPAPAGGLTDFLGESVAPPPPSAGVGGGGSDLFDAEPFQSAAPSAFQSAGQGSFPTPTPLPPDAPVFGGGGFPAPASGFDLGSAMAGPMQSAGGMMPAPGSYAGVPIQQQQQSAPPNFGGGFQNMAPAPTTGMGGFQPQQMPGFAAPPAAAPSHMAIPSSVLPDGAPSLLGDLTMVSSAPPPGPPAAQSTSNPAKAATGGGTLDIGNPFDLG